MYVDSSISTDNVISEADAGELGRFFKVLSEPARLRIVLALSDECRPVSDVVEATGIPQPLVSHHLRILRDAGIARPDRRGAYVYY